MGRKLPYRPKYITERTNCNKWAESYRTGPNTSQRETDVVPGGSEGDPVSAEIENKGIRMTEGVKETESHVKAGSESSSFKTDPRLGPVVSSSDSSEDDLTDQ
ncbi:Cytochrome P450 94A1, partial [Clarias magur]